VAHSSCGEGGDEVRLAASLLHDKEAYTSGDSEYHLAIQVPFEGEGGLFFQTWYPICLSSDVGAGEVIGRNFLDGRVVVVRGENGRARVQSAYCPHVGADLSVGRVVGNRLQCAFHEWEYDESGSCVKTGVGDPPPRSACIFNFPTLEKYDVICNATDLSSQHLTSVAQPLPCLFPGFLQPL